MFYYFSSLHSSIVALCSSAAGDGLGSSRRLAQRVQGLVACFTTLPRTPQTDDIHEQEVFSLVTKAIYLFG